MEKTILIVGGGISGLIASANIKHKHPYYNVILVEKNDVLGGRLFCTTKKDWTYNNGPSWYWMDDIIKKVYSEIGIKPADIYTITELNPQYKLVLESKNVLVPNNLEEFRTMIADFDPTCLSKFDIFIENNKYKYNLITSLFINYYNLSLTEYFSILLPYYVYKLDLFKSYRDSVHISSNKNIQRLMEWPSVFIGSGPKNVSGLFSFLTYSMIVNGTSIPKNGMISIIELLENHINSLNVSVIKEESLYHLTIKDNKVEEAIILDKDYNERTIKVDSIICACDYNYIENILPNKFRSYPKVYWDNQVMCPSAIIFNVMLDIKIPHLYNHTLFFDTSMDKHLECIYNTNNMPNEPLFYINKYSDTTDCDKLFILIPANLNNELCDCEMNQDEIKRLFNYCMKKLEDKYNVPFISHITKYEHTLNENFRYRFYSYKGNAYGLACDNYQLGFFRPKLKSRYLTNLYYCGQMSNPGPGIPPVMISGLLASNLVIHELNYTNTLFDKIVRFFSNVWVLITNMIVMMVTIGIDKDWIKKEFNYVFFGNVEEYNSFNY